MLRAYFAALRKEWVALMTGALTIPLTFVALFMDTTWQRVVFGLFALACALFASFRVWAVEHQRANALAVAQLPDVAALHEANTRHENEIARRVRADEELRKQLADREPRTLDADQIARIEAGLKPIQDWTAQAYTRLAEIYVVATAGAPDSLHYAHVLAGVLKTAFHVEVIAPSDWHYEPQEATGLVLVEPDSWPVDFPDYGQILIDAFALAGLDVTRYPERAASDLLLFKLLIGRKSLR